MIWKPSHDFNRISAMMSLRGQLELPILVKARSNSCPLEKDYKVGGRMINVDYMPCRFIRSDQYFWIKLCNDHIDQIVQWSFAEPAWLETLQRISEISSIIIPAGKIGSTWERSPSTLPSYVLEYQSSSKYPLESRTHSLYILLVS